jgi:regulator of protease activity HflC (stomatin/prohibitin superfamily)
MMTFLTVVAFLGIVYGVAGYILTKVNPKTPILPQRSLVLKVSIAVFAFCFVINETLQKIGAQEVGVVVSPTGVKHEPLTTGWHLVMPWNTVKRMDKTIWVYTLTSNIKEGAKNADDAIWAPTSDGIKMGFDISVNWRIDASEAAWVYSNMINDQAIDGRYKWMEENIIRPAIKSIMPLTVSKYTPIECYSDKRNEIQQKVQEALKKELISNRIIVDVAQIREVYYNKDYEASINAKKLAEQEVLRLVQVTRQKDEQLKQAEIDKNIAIEKAEGEAKSLKIKGEAINQNPKIVQLEWIAKWDGVLPTYMMGNGQNVMMNLGDAKAK